MRHQAVRVVAHVCQAPALAAPVSPPAVQVAHTQAGTRPSAVQLRAPGVGVSVSELAFDACYSSRDDDELFEAEVAPLVTHALAGGNSAALVFGPEGTSTLADVVRRCLVRLLDAKEPPSVELALVEVDAERVRDLMMPSSSSPPRTAELAIRQLVDGSVAVNGLSRRRVTTARDGNVLYEAVGRNATNTRGHSVLIAYVTTTNPTSGAVRRGKLHVVDVSLSGSAKNSVSHFVLGKVAAALNAGDSQLVSFRESKLTRLLQDSLGGGSCAVMICCASPLSNRFQESLQALTFASKARGAGSGVGTSSSSEPSAPAPGWTRTIATSSSASTSPSPPVSGRVRRPNFQPNANTSNSESRGSTSVPVTPIVRQQGPLLVKSSTAVSRTAVGAPESMESKLAAWRARKSSGGDSLSAGSRASRPNRSSESNRCILKSLKRRATVSTRDLKPTLSLQSTPTSSPWVEAAGNHASPTKPKPLSVERPSSTSTSGVASAPDALVTSDASGDREQSTPATPTVTIISEGIVTKATPALAPASKKARLADATPSERLTSVMVPRSTDIGVHGVTDAASKAPIRTGSPASEKENQSDPATSARFDEKPILVAKQLIAMAIELEKKRRFRSALCLLRRAYSVLPAENARLVERMRLLEVECPDAASFVPSQQLSTSAYVRVVMERDLLEVVNSVSAEQLVDLPAIGGKRAERIVDARPFSQLADLRRVQGITDSVLLKLVERYAAWTPPV